MICVVLMELSQPLACVYGTKFPTQLGQRYELLSKFPADQHSCRIILKRSSSLKVLSSACENHRAESERTLQTSKESREHQPVLTSTGEGYGTACKGNIWLWDLITYYGCGSSGDDAVHTRSSKVSNDCCSLTNMSHLE
jgi:hypothetical protein